MWFLRVELVEESGEYEFKLDNDQGELDTTRTVGQCVSWCCKQNVCQVQCACWMFIFSILHEVFFYKTIH